MVEVRGAYWCWCCCWWWCWVVVVGGGGGGGVQKLYKFPQINPFWFTEMDEFDGWDGVQPFERQNPKTFTFITSPFAADV